MDRIIGFKCWDGKKMWKYAVPLLEPAYNGGMIRVSDQADGWGGRIVNGKLLQYTDYKDKNNIQICEGDIINNERNSEEFSNGCWNLNGDIPLSHFKKDSLEIIGNIYEEKQDER